MDHFKGRRPLVVAVIGIAVAGRLAFIQNREQRRQSMLQIEAAEIAQAQYSYELVSTYVHIFRTIFDLRAITLLSRDIVIRLDNSGEPLTAETLDIDDFIRLLEKGANDIRALGFNPKMDQAAARLIGDVKRRFDIFLWLLTAVRNQSNEKGFSALVSELMYEAASDLKAMVYEAAGRLPTNLAPETRYEIESRLERLEEYESAQQERFKNNNEKAVNFIISNSNRSHVGAHLGRSR